MATFRRDEAGIAYVTRSPFGPVGQDLRRRTVNVNVAARATAPVGRDVPADAWSRGHKAGGLRRAVRSEIVVRPTGLFGRVIAETGYATTVHEGSKPHEIRPIRRRYLRWRTGAGYGEQIFARRVAHPGNRRANPFLRRALREAQR